MVVLALLDEKARRLVVEPAEDEDEAGEHDVDGCRHDPRVVGVLVDVERRAPGREIGQHDSDVDGPSEDACAETTDGFGSDLGDVDGCDYDGSVGVSQCVRLSRRWKVDAYCPMPRPAMNRPA